MDGVNLISEMSEKVKVSTHCSIIFSGGKDINKLNSYFIFLSRQNLQDDHELIVINDCGLPINESNIKTLLPSLKVLNSDHQLSQSQLFEKGTDAARGKYLLFVRNFVNFDIQLLEESINDLEVSGDKMSISANRNFVLTERSHLINTNGFEKLLQGFDLNPVQTKSVCPEQTCICRDLHNKTVSLKCGPGTFVDPEVIVDSCESIKIGSNTTIRKGVVLRPEGGKIVIGDNCVINHYCIFHGKGGIYLGDWTIVAPHCGFYAQNHTYKSFDIPIVKQPNIGKGIYLMGDNWIGSHAVICDDVTIGKGSIVGANSTVTRSIPMASIAVGTPAKVIKKRYSSDWDFHQRERAAVHGMPQEMCEHVTKRGMLIQELIEANDTVLDLGCGEGIITAILSEKSRRITGCDYSTEAVNLARQRHPNIEFVYSNSTNLALGDRLFTKIIMSDVAEHLLPIQLINTLAEVNRILCSGGRLILATPLTGKQKNTSTYAHIYEYSENEMNKILNGAFCDVKLVNRQFGIFIAQKR